MKIVDIKNFKDYILRVMRKLIEASFGSMENLAGILARREEVAAEEEGMFRVIG